MSVANTAVASRRSGWRALGILVAAVLTFGATSVPAHHSIVGTYDRSRQTTVDGVITQFRFVSPHPFIELKDARSGQLWEIELDNRHEFEAIGITAGSFKPGDRVTVTGSLSRQGANGMYARRLHRQADGFGFEEQAGRPRLSGPAR